MKVGTAGAVLRHVLASIKLSPISVMPRILGQEISVETCDAMDTIFYSRRRLMNSPNMKNDCMQVKKF